MGVELKLGSEFIAGGTRLIVVKGKGCDNCLFKESEDCHDLTCEGSCRKDKTDVIFVESNLPDVSDLPAPPKEEDIDESINPFPKLSAIAPPPKPDTRSYNVGASDYSKHAIQPWDIWNEYRLNPYDADITKRTLRKKTEPGMTWVESRILDYKKIIHICQERIRQLESGEDPFGKEEE